MDKKQLTMGQILESVKNHEISATEGFQRIKELQSRTGSANLDAPGLVYFHEEWKEALVDPQPLSEGEFSHSLVFVNNDSLWAALYQSLGNASQLTRVRPGTCFQEHSKNDYQINPADFNDYRQLLAALNQTPFRSIRVIHLWAYENSFEPQISPEIQLEHGVFSAFYICKAMMAEKYAKIRFLYIYSVVDDLGEAYAQVQPMFAAVNGLGRTIHQENPGFGFRTIQIQNATGDSLAANRLGEIIPREISNIDWNEAEVQYRQRQRYRKVLQPLDLEEKPEMRDGIERDGSKNLIQPGGVYMITGGAGGLGFILAGYLVQQAPMTLVLVGRSPLTPEKEAKIAALQGSGATIVYHQADVADPGQVKKLVKDIKSRYKKIDGVIHGAGVLQDSFLIQKSPEEFKRVLDPKVFGAIHLDEATRREPLAFFIMFSSLAGLVGNSGQGDYAFANSFLDHFAQVREIARLRKQRSGKTLAINWPLWENGGMGMAVEQREIMFRETGIMALPAAEGYRAFQATLDSGHCQVAVCYGNRRKISSFLTESSPEQARHSAKAQDVDRNVLKIQTAKFLQDLFAGLLKMTSAEMDPDVSFQEYGVDSLLINQFNQTMEKTVGALSKTLLFEYQNLRDLTEYMVDNHSQELAGLFGIQPAKPVTNVVPDQPAVQLNQAGNGEELVSFREKQRAASFIGLPFQSACSNNMEIAIIGMNGRYPQAAGLDQFWENLKSGRDCITEVPPERWDIRKFYHSDPLKAREGKMYCKWGGFLDQVGHFDPLFFNISPSDAEMMDPQERLFLESVWVLMESNGYTRQRLQVPSRERGARVGVFAGVTSYTYLLLGADQFNQGFAMLPSPWSIANRISYYFNFQGPSLPVDTACSSGLTAVHLACDSLRKGECDLAIAGGVNLYLHPSKYIGMCQLKMLSPKGRCHSFGASGDGFVPGEGVGTLLLKPLSQARLDGDNILGVILGSSINHGGSTNGFTVPNPNAQAGLIAETLKKANIDPRTISYMEAHGTGTSLGDPIEISGLTKAFREYTTDKQFCAIGSVKSNIGHLESAAGIAGLAKILLQMKYKQRVPSLHARPLNPNIDFANSPFYVQQELDEWRQPEDPQSGAPIPRRAGLSSFGAGGANAHVLVEEYIPVHYQFSPEAPGPEPQIITISARNEERLTEYAANIKAYLEQVINEPDSVQSLPSFPAIAYTLQLGREAMEERMALVARDIPDLIAKLDLFQQGRDNIENTYRGNVRANKHKTLITGEAGNQFLKIIIRDKDLNKLAEVWATGVDLDWTLVYPGRKHPIVPWPTYPFAREHYWIPEQFTSGSTRRNLGKLHPLLDSNHSTLEEQCFQTTFYGDEFFLTDHVIHNDKVLPGVAYLEMARAAGDLANPSSPVIQIKNNIWAKPVVLKGTPVETRISLYPNNEIVEYEISSISGDDSGAGTGERAIHVQGTLVFKNHMALPDKEPVALDAIKQRCPIMKTGDECYRQFQQAGFHYGTSFQTIQELYANEIECLAVLRLKPEEQSGAEEYHLHPALMDGALQAILGLSFAKPVDHQVFVPFAVGELDIAGPVACDTCYAYVTFSNQSMGAEANVRKFNIQIVNPDGKVLVTFRDFSARAYKPASDPIRMAADEAAATAAKPPMSLAELLRQIEEGKLHADEAEKLMEEIHG